MIFCSSSTQLQQARRTLKERILLIVFPIKLGRKKKIDKGFLIHTPSGKGQNDSPNIVGPTQLDHYVHCPSSSLIEAPESSMAFPF